MNNKRNRTQLLWGVLLLAAGILLGGKALFHWDINLFFRGWWTLFIIVPAVVSMLEDGVKTDNAVLLVIGIALLLKVRAVGIFGGLTWEAALAAVLVFIAVKLLLGVFAKRQNRLEDRSFSDSSAGQACAGEQEKSAEKKAVSFAEKTYSYAGKPFEGGSFESRFGDVTVDLKEAEITGDITVFVRVRFGHALVRTPDNIRVETASDVSLGVVEDDKARGKTGEHTLRIVADVRFGALEIM